MSADLLLNATWLRNRLAELGLRQWWLAEQVGVDRRTVLRWVNGQVRQIQPAHARALAQVLGCAVHDLLLADPAVQLASADDQRAAGLALAAGRLLDRLGPVGEWDVAERLIKASAVPDLPLHVLGRLYHQLCVACWRQDKLDEARGHNAAALDIARRIDDRALLADALGSAANLHCWRGELPAALARWDEALALAAWLTPRQRGSLLNNRGASLVETGSWEAGRADLLAALQCFDAEGTAMNHAIVRAQLALAALAPEDPALAGEARSQADRARAHAERADDRRSLALVPLLDAGVAALLGRREEAAAAIAQGLRAFAALGIDDAINHLLVARAWRQLGNTAAALDEAGQALRRSEGFPLERAAVLLERARCLSAAGQAAAAVADAREAEALARTCGAAGLAGQALRLADAAMSPHVTRQADAPPLP